MDILGDLFELEPVEITLPTENIEFLNEEQKLNQLYQQLQRCTRVRKRIMTLYYAFKIGQIIESCSSRAQKSLLKSRLTSHFYQGCVRTFLIFENLGVEQIFRTKIITFNMIRILKSQEFRLLCENIPQ
jgi:hypothetical protein